MARCKLLPLALVLVLHSAFGDVGSNIFLSGEYKNSIDSHPITSEYENSISKNIFLEHAVFSRQAQPFTAPKYLPPKEYIKCGGGQQCVKQNVCIGGYFTNNPNGYIQNCEPETDVCCTYRPPPTPTTTTQRPYVPCAGDSDCVPPNQCSRGTINVSNYAKKSSANRCYAPEVCCRLPATALTPDGYVLTVPVIPFPQPPQTPQTYNPTPTPPVYIPPERPTQAPYRPTQPPAPPVYQPPATPAPPVYIPPSPTAPPAPQVYIPPAKPQLPVYQPPVPQRPQYIPPQTPAPEYIPPQTPAPQVYQPPRPQPPRPQPPRPQPPTYIPPPVPQRPVPQTPQTYIPPSPPQPQPPRPQPVQPLRPQPQPQPQPPRPQPQRPINEYLPPVPRQPQQPQQPRQPLQPQQPLNPIGSPSNQVPVRGEEILSEPIFPTRKPPVFEADLSPFTPQKCAAALVCTDINFCSSLGIITDSPSNLTPQQEAFRVPLTDCLIEGSGAPGKCCRDSNYVDPWPVNPTGQCATRNRNTKPRGVTDEDTAFAEIPWQAMVLKESSKSLLCGGAIIGYAMVLTTASCLAGEPTKDILVKAGEWQLGIDDEPLPFQLVRATEIEVHPGYDPATGQNNLAIILLEKNLQTAIHISPICISDKDPSPSERCVVTGWGKNALKIHEQGALLHQTPADAVSRSECGASETQVCARTKYDACDVDYGSALACGTGDSYVLKGTFTSEDQCGNSVASFTKPDIKWINTAFNQNNRALLLG